MKLICEISVYNRMTPQVKPRSQQSTLALGYHPPGAAKDADNLFLIHFTATNKVGTRYKLKSNIEKVFTKFVKEGKSTISLKQPQHDLQIRCDSTSLKAFLQTLKNALEGKLDPTESSLSTLAVTGVPQKAMPVKTMEIFSPSDYPLKGLPKTLTYLTVSGIRKCSIDSSILSLYNLQVLDLTDNHIEHIPKKLGDLPLVYLNLSKNRLGNSEPSDWDWILRPRINSSLQNLILSHNDLDIFPYKVVKLRKLVTLDLRNNSLQRIPFAIRRLQKLRILNLTDNRLITLPNVFNTMSFTILDVSGSEMFPRFLKPHAHFDHPPVRQPHSLWQLAAKTMIIKHIKYGPFDLPATVIDSLEEFPFCSGTHCQWILCPPTLVELGAVNISFQVASLITSDNNIRIMGDQAFCSDYCRFGRTFH